MSRNRVIQWLILAATAGLMVLLKELHIGVTHYNVFLIILVGWILALVIAFRPLTAGRRSDN
jgi:hypothetical protein